MFRTLVLALVVVVGASASAKDPNTLLKKIMEDPKPLAKDIATARWLLHHGASYKAVSKRGFTVVMFAARFGDVPLLKAAIKAGVDVNAHTFDWKTTALMFANPLKMRIILDAGADPNAQDYIGRTPLMWAAQWKSRKGIELLLAHGAKPDVRNTKGYSALVYAKGSPGLEKLLRERGAG